MNYSKIPLVPLVAALTLSSQGAVAADTPAPQKRPNFIIILADDMGYGDPTCFGGSIPTPNIDKMAEEGMRFTDFHSSGTVCSPTRAGLVTGLYQQRTGVDGVVTADPKCAAYTLGVDPEKFTTFPQLLAKANYKTAIFGKWHLGYLEKYNPMNFSFDRFVGYISGNIDYISHYDRMGTYDWWHGRKQVKEEGYSTHLITKHAVNYIKENKDNPFCIYVAHEAVHSPMQGPTDVIQRGPDKVKGQRRNNKAVFKDMLQEMDKGVGQVIQAVKDAGIADNTLVIFTSDNGPMQFSSPGPLKGRKGSIYEGGHRVPTVAWWPGTIKAGTETGETAISIDIVPTMMDLADIKTRQKFDGVSLKPVLTGGALAPRKLFWRKGGLSPFSSSWDCKDSDKAIRDGKWKLVAKPYYKSVMLYDLENDLGESKNLAAAHPERVAQMKADLMKWETEIIGTLPYNILTEEEFKTKNRQRNGKKKSGKKSPQPNFVLLFVDDLGWSNLGYRDAAFESPNIDRLARDGLDFQQAYIAGPACSPSRGTLLTGKHPAQLQLVRHIPGGTQHGFDKFGRTTRKLNFWKTDPARFPSANWLALTHETYAEALGKLGYYNLFIGKWHLGHEEYHPVHQGFDRQVGTSNYGAPASYYPPYFLNSAVLADEKERYLTDKLTDEAVEFIDTYNNPQPFMLTFWYYSAHTPHQGRRDLVKHFENKGLTGKRAHFAAMVKAVDESVGRIRGALARKGIAEDTILIFLSDQGGYFENKPFRGAKKKDTLYEGGARVPFIFHWPGVTKPGGKNNSVVQSTDIFPTLVEIAGGKPADYVHLDGVSLAPVIKMNNTLARGKPVFGYRAYEDLYASVREGDWKLLAYRSGKTKLYNLANDIGEQNDLASSEPEKTRALTDQLIDWEQDMGVESYSGVQ